MQARAVACAAVCILRIQRSHLRAQVDTQVGEDMYFEAIRIERTHSIQNNDLDARSAIILTQLWSSKRMFKFKDGSVDGLRLLLRGRLVSFDINPRQLEEPRLLFPSVYERLLRLSLVVARRVWRPPQPLPGLGARSAACSRVCLGSRCSCSHGLRRRA